MAGKSKNQFGHGMLDLWELAPDTIHLNHGGFGATPARVARAAERLRQQIAANPTTFMEDRLTGALRHAAGDLANFLGGEGKDLVFVDNATTGINALLRSLVFMPGDEVVTTNHLHISARRTLEFVCERAGARLIFADVPFPIRHAGDAISGILGALSPRTRLVMIDHVTAHTALCLPIEQIGQRCAERNIPVMVDGAHGPGNIAVDLSRLAANGVRWYAGNGHIWLCGELGCGFLWVHPDQQGLIRPTTIANHFGEGFTESFDWPGSKGFDAWLAISESIAIQREFGADRVRDYCHGLAQQACALLTDRWKSVAGAPPELSSSMSVVALPGETPATHDAAARFRRSLRNEHNIEVLVFPFNGRLWVRLSAYLYNEISDYERLADAVAQEISARPRALQH